jgi:hypothetical protein
MLAKPIDIIDRKQLLEFRKSAETLYTLEYARAVVNCNPKGKSLIPQVLLGDSYNGLRDKAQKFSVPTKTFHIAMCQEQALLYEALGENKWLRPLLNAILADLVDWSKYVASNKSLKTKEALAISSRLPASLLSRELANRIEASIGSNKLVQRSYNQLGKTLLWKDMEELRIVKVCSMPRVIKKPKTAVEKRLKKLGYKMMDAGLKAEPIHRFKKKEI